jgi:nucleoside 2-deoxyribosyltransferase
MTYSLYLAAKYDKREQVNQIAEQVRQSGHTVRAEWLDGSHTGLSEDEQWSYARKDLTDIRACTHFVMFQLPVEHPELSAGRHVELGYAMALGKYCIIVGGGESVFYTLAHRYPTVEAFLAALAQVFNAEKT